MASKCSRELEFEELNQEIGYTKVRWQLTKEKEEEEEEKEAGVSERKKQKLPQPSTEEEEKRKKGKRWMKHRPGKYKTQ